MQYLARAFFQLLQGSFTNFLHGCGSRYHYGGLQDYGHPYQPPQTDEIGRTTEDQGHAVMAMTMKTSGRATNRCIDRCQRIDYKVGQGGYPYEWSASSIVGMALLRRRHDIMGSGLHPKTSASRTTPMGCASGEKAP